MAARIAGRLLTSPVAFALAGAFDLLRFLAAATCHRWHHRIGRSTMPSDVDRAPAP